MEIINKWKDDKGVWWVEVVCPSCGQHQDIRRSNSYKRKTCSDCSSFQKSLSLTTHGMYSKSKPNPELKRCRDKVQWMTHRSYSDKHPTYLGICRGLDVKRNGEYQSSLTLQRVLGTPPPDHSIEKWGNFYHCGECDECKENQWSCSLLGYIPFQDQKWTRSNTFVFHKGNERVCLNHLSDLIDVPQSTIDYLFYKKFRHIEDINDRWFKVRNHLVTHSSCPECMKTVLERN